MSAHTDEPDSGRRTGPVLRNRAFWAAFLLGAASMAAIDEIVFHQILAWHHFYDRSTTEIALLSDGLLHAAELFAFAAGFFLMLDARRRGVFSAAVAWSGYFVGLGVFQLWDGVIDHKVLGVHQIRYGVDLLPYDIAWIISGLVLLTIGCVLTVVSSRRARGIDRTSATPRSR
ncbi:DUF2243 domain-containing protein [Microbacterium sp.]|uniref:DUF2243 domain-containing protein n=1 Tax=Microbacterium sp. TaxID=51671 RepID=UPI002811B5EC|nr:DUF2243 domain-containing protein [Microbacterium sp.]